MATVKSYIRYIRRVRHRTVSKAFKAGRTLIGKLVAPLQPVQQKPASHGKNEPPVYHVRPGDKGWIITFGNSGHVVHRFSRKAEAVKSAMRLAKNERRRLAIYSRKGEVQKRYAFSPSYL